MSHLKEFMEAHRQTGNTTELLKLVSETKGYLIVADAGCKWSICKNNPDFIYANLILTLDDIEMGDWKNDKKLRTAFFDNSAIIILMSKPEPLAYIKIDNKDYKPTFKDLEAWKSVFEEAQHDKDFKIFTHEGVTIDRLTSLQMNSQGDLELNTKDPLTLDSKLILAINDGYQPASQDGYVLTWDSNSATWYTQELPINKENAPPSLDIGSKKQQMNVKLTDADVQDIKAINDDFFEGEASNSMLGRILLRKGIFFYKKLREKF